MLYDTNCTRMVFLRYGFFYGILGDSYVHILCGIDCTCKAFLQHELSHAFQDNPFVQMLCCKYCSYMASPQYAFLHDFQDCPYMQMCCDIDCTDMPFLQFWTLVWSSRWPFCETVLLHKMKVSDISLFSSLIWLPSLLFCANTMWHWVRWWAFPLVHFLMLLSLTLPCKFVSHKSYKLLNEWICCRSIDSIHCGFMQDIPDESFVHTRRMHFSAFYRVFGLQSILRPKLCTDIFFTFTILSYIIACGFVIFFFCGCFLGSSTEKKYMFSHL